MKKAAIEKARRRLIDAKAELEAVCACTNFAQFQQCWYKFLCTANSIDAVLEFGSRSDPKTRPWYGQKINLRRKDPLLGYMHQARNVDEHGIEGVTEHVPGSLVIGVAGESVHVNMMVSGPDFTYADLSPVNGKLPTVRVTRPHVRLISVKDDRFGDVFDPPTVHLGQPIQDTSPIGVATLWLHYLNTLVDEAEARVR